MKNVTPIGGPLNKNAIEELGLDENQVAGINDALKDEGKRMHERLAAQAARLLPDKTPEQLAGMNDLEITYALMPHLVGDLEALQKLPLEDRKAIQTGKKHFVNYLPRSSNLVRIAHDFYEERQKTYDNLAPHLSEEQEEKLKEKYFATGTFIFPGGASFGIGPLSEDDFQDE
jgi:hypothetical protein